MRAVYMMLCVELHSRSAARLQITPVAVSLLCTVQEQWRWTLESLLLLEGQFDYSFEDQLKGQCIAQS